MSKEKITKERTKEVQNAIDVAFLWRAGKMIGADENEVCDALLREIERLEKITGDPET